MRVVVERDRERAGVFKLERDDRLTLRDLAADDLAFVVLALRVFFAAATRDVL